MARITEEQIKKIRNILIDEGQRNSLKYGFSLGETIKFNPTQVEEILTRRINELANEVGRMTWYKAFDKDLKCRGMQYKVGEEYKLDGKPTICNQGFHYCKSIADCYRFYPMTDDTRICEVEPLGEVVEDENGVKFCTNHIKIVREIENLREMSNANKSSSGFFNSGSYNSGNWNSGCNNSGSYNSGSYNSGYYNSGRYNSGDYNSGCNNSGSYNSGSYNSGYYNSGCNNSGSYNSGCNNSGSYNSGSYNSGYYNSGRYNSGDYNSGDYNTGSYNSGRHNSGYYNSGNYSSGVFNTAINPKIRIFDKESNWTIADWYSSRAFEVICSYPNTTTSFVYESDMSDEEKFNHPEYTTIGGYVKEVIVTKEDKQKWWDNLSDKDKQAIYDLPNFDADKFEKCTEIKVNLEVVE